MTSKSPVYLLQPSPQNDTLWGLLMDALRVLARSSWHGQVSQTRLYKVKVWGLLDDCGVSYSTSVLLVLLGR